MPSHSAVFPAIKERHVCRTLRCTANGKLLIKPSWRFAGREEIAGQQKRDMTDMTAINKKQQLVGGWATPLKNMKVNWDHYSQYMGK